MAAADVCTDSSGFSGFYWPQLYRILLVSCGSGGADLMQL